MAQKTPQPPKGAAAPLMPSSNKKKDLAFLMKMPRRDPEESPRAFAIRALCKIADSMATADNEIARDEELSEEEEKSYAILRHKNRVKRGKITRNSSKISSKSAHSSCEEKKVGLAGMINSLTELETFVPSGIFRRMHNNYAFSGYPKDRFPDEISWPDIKLSIDGSSLATLLREVERNAWIFGKDGNLSICDSLWDSLTPTARGRMLAGASERNLMDWIFKKWELGYPMVFDAVSATQICCNLIRDRSLLRPYRQKLLSSVLETARNWNGQIIERLEDFTGESQSRWSDEMSPLSQRAIDICLESALRVEDTESVRFCLAAGADPNIGIWVLGRSFNERYCALSYAIEKCYCSTIAITLLDAGADPTGTDYDGRNRPLYGALSFGGLHLADTLLDLGAAFTWDENREFDPTSREREASFRIHCRSEELEWAEQCIGKLITLQDPSHTPYYYHGDGQGGYYGNFLGIFLKMDDIKALRLFESRGLPIELSAYDLLQAIFAGAGQCLSYILQHLNAPPEVMNQILMRYPDFAKNTLQEPKIIKTEPGTTEKKTEIAEAKPKESSGRPLKTVKEIEKAARIKELEKKLAAACQYRPLVTQRIYYMQSLEYKAKGLVFEWRIFAQFKRKCPLHLKPIITISELSPSDLIKWDRLMKRFLKKLNKKNPAIFPPANVTDLNIRFPDTFPI